MRTKRQFDSMSQLSSWLVFALLVLSATVIPAGPSAVAQERLLSTASHPPTVQSSATQTAPTTARLAEAYGKFPLSFEANQGQSDAQVKFLSRAAGYSLFLTPQEAVLALRAQPPQETTVGKTRGLDATRKIPDETRTAVVRLQLIGANPSPRITGEGELPGKSNYLLGKDPKQWHTNIPHYS